MLHEEITLEEKIDYIYDQMKKEQRKKWYRLYMRVSLFLLLVVAPYYLFITYLPQILSGGVNMVMGQKLPSTPGAQGTSATPTGSVGDIIKGYTKNMSADQKDAIRKTLESVLGGESTPKNTPSY